MKYLCLTVLIISLMFGGKFLIDKSLAEEPQPKPVSSCDFSEETLLREINRVRENPVKMNPKIDKIAESRSKEITKDWSHDGFKKINPGDYGFKGFGENLLRADTLCSSALAVDSWLDSPIHKEVMLRDSYKYIGIGIYQNHVVTIYGY